MPKRAVRQWFLLVDRYHKPLMFLMMLALIFALIVAVLGWNTARNVENQLQAERIGKAIADVTTCFNSADRRPQLETILRGIASELQPDPRAALNGYIDNYTANTPSRDDCAKLAESMSIDPAPYLSDPPSEAGNGQEGS